MGEAQKRLEKSGEKVLFDAASIGLRIGKGDRIGLSRNPPDDPAGESSPELVEFRAFVVLARAVSSAAFPQGMDRKDGKFWAAWQDVLDDEVPAVSVTRGQVEWLARHVNSDSVKTAAQLAGWREAVGEYLTELAAAPVQAPSPEAARHAPLGAPVTIPANGRAAVGFDQTGG